MTDDRETQMTAVFLIVFAAVCIAIGSHFEWRDLNNFATAFGGAGAGILTSSKRSSVMNKDGGTINVAPSDAS